MTPLALPASIAPGQPGLLEGAQAYFGNLGFAPIVGLAAPFVLLLVGLATLPLLAPHFWEKNKNKAFVSLVLGVPIAAFIAYRDANTLANTLLDYAAFIALLGALFTISGGIYLRGSFAGRPATNTLFLLSGALLANLIGTTGASMLIVRPLIRANKSRQRKVHVIIFLIFIVSNGAGLLTPLGDPPLFVGFLRGVPFSWTLRLWREWLFVTGTLLILFHLLDRYQLSKETPGAVQPLAEPAMATGDPPRAAWPHLRDGFGLEGAHNLVFLALVVGLIMFSGYVIDPIGGRRIFGEPFGSVLSKLVQTAGMGLIGLISYKMTRPQVRQLNAFNFGPIIEVAVLFAGIFATMIPVLLVLETQGDKLGVSAPWHFFWLTGGLSSFLDNTPTYLTFTSLSKGILSIPAGEGLKELVMDPAGALHLAAISTGAVLMGANTYIGNGPNFMVKAIADEAKIKMPSFFGYMVWPVAILIPLFLAVTLLFFRG